MAVQNLFQNTIVLLTAPGGALVIPSCMISLRNNFEKVSEECELIDGFPDCYSAEDGNHALLNLLENVLVYTIEREFYRSIFKP